VAHRGPGSRQSGLDSGRTFGVLDLLSKTTLLNLVVQIVGKLVTQTGWDSGCSSSVQVVAH